MARNDSYWLTASSRYFDLAGELKLTRLHPAILEVYRLSGGGGKVLDFGCGEGGLSVQIARLGGKVLAVDKSPVAIERTKKRCEKVDYLNVRLVDDSYEPIRENAPYDWIICSLVLETIEDEREAETAFRLFSDISHHGSQLLLGCTHPCFHDQAFSTFKMQLDVRSHYSRISQPYRVEVRDAFDPKQRVVFTDFHRPLSRIFSLLSLAGFHAGDIKEIYDYNMNNLHHENIKEINLNVPAFLLLIARKDMK
jgi:cyclopropane fatty-acyl-phospholipid synthase-like methyltransferase